MKNKDIDNIFRDKLAGLETPVDGDLWAAIEKSLDSSVGAPVPVAANRSGAIHWNWRKALRYGASVAAIVLVALLLWPERSLYQEEVQKTPVLASESEENVIPVQEVEGEYNPENDMIAAVGKGGNVAGTGAGAAGISVESVGKMVVVADGDKVVADGDKVAANAGTAADGVSDAGKTVAAVEEESAEELKAKSTETLQAKSVQAVGAKGEEVLENENAHATEAQNVDMTAYKAEQQSVAAIGESVAEYAERTDRRVRMESVREGKRRTYTLAVASNFISSSSAAISSQYLGYMSSGGLEANGIHSVEQISETQYALPLNFGVQAQVKLTSLLSVGLGLNYTLLKSKYEALINKRYYRIRQHLHYVGVPINLYFRLVDRSNFYFYANVGGSFEKGVSASYKMSSYDAVAYDIDGDMGGIQYSGNVGFGMEYKFIPQLGIYLEPNLVYYFNSELPASIRTDQPLQVKAEIGFRFHLNNNQQ